MRSVKASTTQRAGRSLTVAEVDFILPQNLRIVWPYVRTRLDRLAMRSKSEWIQEDVFLACATGKATLHTIKESGELTGFFVLEQTQEFGTPSLHVWVMWHDGTADDALYSEVLEQLKRYGYAGKAARLRFSTTRKGWAKRLERFGWKPTLQYLEITL